MEFQAAAFNPSNSSFKVGSVTPKQNRSKSAIARKRQDNRRHEFKRAVNMEEGRRRRTVKSKSIRRKRKDNVMAKRRFRTSGDSSKENKERDEVCSNKEMLVSFYKKYNPGKLNEVDDLMAKYLGREEDMFRILVKKYNADPICFESKMKPYSSSKSTSVPTTNVTTLDIGTVNAPTFGTPGILGGFGSSFTSPNKPFSSFSNKGTPFGLTKGENRGFSFGSLATTKTSTFGSGFGASVETKQPSCYSIWGQQSNVRTNESYDSDTQDGMECD